MKQCNGNTSYAMECYLDIACNVYHQTPAPLSVAILIIVIATLLSIVHELHATCFLVRSHLISNLIIDSLNFKKVLELHGRS